MTSSTDLPSELQDSDPYCSFGLSSCTAQRRLRLCTAPNSWTSLIPFHSLFFNDSTTIQLPDLTANSFLRPCSSFSYLLSNSPPSPINFVLQCPITGPSSVNTCFEWVNITYTKAQKKCCMLARLEEIQWGWNLWERGVGCVERRWGRVQLGEMDESQGKQPQRMVKWKIPSVGLTREWHDQICITLASIQKLQEKQL